MTTANVTPAVSHHQSGDHAMRPYTMAAAPADSTTPSASDFT